MSGAKRDAATFWSAFEARLAELPETADAANQREALVAMAMRDVGGRPSIDLDPVAVADEFYRQRYVERATFMVERMNRWDKQRKERATRAGSVDSYFPHWPADMRGDDTV